jgi:hypothetical protein
LRIFGGALRIDPMTGKDGERAGRMVEQAEIVRDMIVTGGDVAGLSAATILASRMGTRAAAHLDADDTDRAMARPGAQAVR